MGLGAEDLAPEGDSGAKRAGFTDSGIAFAFLSGFDLVIIEFYSPKK